MQSASFTLTLFKLGIVSLGVVAFHATADKLPVGWRVLGWIAAIMSVVIVLPDFIAAIRALMRVGSQPESVPTLPNIKAPRERLCVVFNGRQICE